MRLTLPWSLVFLIGTACASASPPSPQQAASTGNGRPSVQNRALTIVVRYEVAQRTRQFVRMQQLLSEQLPVFFTHFAIAVTIHVAALRGPDTVEATGSGTFTPATLTYWNVHEWEWQ